MELIADWLLFPALLAVLALGCGLAADRVGGLQLGRALLVPLGLATMIVIGQFTTVTEATAEATTPILVAVGLGGLWLGRERLRRPGPSPWLIAAVFGTFAVYAAPIVLSGDATFAGYIKLDDTATWMALTDRVMEHGRDISGLTPSSYEATLAFNLADGYPIGVFIPLGAGAAITGQDVAWLIQPYMTLMASLLTLTLWSLLRPLIESAPLRALVAFGGALSSLLLGYVLWGGVKEIAAAVLIALFAALVGHELQQVGEGVPAADSGPKTAGRSRFPTSGRIATTTRKPSARSVIPLAIAATALLGVLSPGGAIWLLVPSLGGIALLTLRERRSALRTAASFVIATAVLSIPLIAGGRLLPPTSSPLTDNDAKGNLAEALDPFQVAGIWPTGDFRFQPDQEAVAYALIIAVIGLALFGLWYAWRARSWGVLLYAGGSLFGFTVLTIAGSPWVAAKATAIASPAVLALGLAGGATLIARGRRLEGAVGLTALLAGVLWSSALAYHDVRLAPRDQLAELEHVGELIAGEGPTLMTEYQPYGVRHFLRESDAEGVSELRRHPIPLRSGRTVEKGQWADTDRIELDDLLAYETLVLRRSPEQSRPPSPYERVFEGDYYDVWQQGGSPEPSEHLPLGDGLDPGARPSCDRVAKLARSAAPGERLLAAPAPLTLVLDPADAELDPDWADAGDKGFVLTGPGEATFPVEISHGGDYELWLKGSMPGRLETLVDGKRVGEVSHQLNNSGLYLDLGRAELASGSHQLTLRYEQVVLAPGSGGPSPSVGPLVLSMPPAAEIVTESPEHFRKLCEQTWDWIEAVAP